MSLTLTFAPSQAYSVKDYGATGNGTTDDTNAIEACRDAASAAYRALGAPSTANPFPYGSFPVYFPPGDYVIRHPIDWVSRVTLIGQDPRTTRIRARKASAGGFSGSQMFRSWRDADWTGGETDHRRAPQQMQAGGLDNVYPQISNLFFLTEDATNLACISWAGANESGYIRNCIFQNPFGGGSNTGNWAIDLQDTRILGGGHFNIAEMTVSKCHVYGGGWERMYSFNNANVTDGSAPNEWGQDLWIQECSIGWDSTGTYHSCFYFNHLQSVNMTNCMMETNMASGSQATIYGVNVQGLSIRGGNWDFLTPKGRTIDFCNVNMAAGLGQDRTGVSVQDVAISTGGSFVEWFSGGAALIKDPYHTIQPDSGTIGQALPTYSNPIANIRKIDEGIIDVRLIDGTIGRVDNTRGTINGVTDVQLNQHYLSCPGGAAFQGFTTPDAAAFDLTTGCDLRALIWPTSLTGSFEQWLIEKFTSSQRSYSFAITTLGKLEFYYSTDGTGFPNLVSSIAIPSNTAPQWVRVVATSNVAGSCQAIFYTSPNGTTWTQLGTTQTNATGAGAAWFSGTSPVSVAQNENSGRFGGRYYRAEIRNLAGTLVGEVDMRALTSHQTYTDSASHVWTPDVLAVQAVDAALHPALVPSGYVLPVAQPDIVDTTGATLANVEIEVNKLKAALRLSGVI